METPTTPERTSQKVLPPTSPKSHPEGEFRENKENAQISKSPRKALPAIPLSASGRMQGAPMSPVRVNAQPSAEDWPPRPSTATIEDENSHFRQISDGSSRSGPSMQYDRTEPPMPVTKDIPYRPNYNTRNGSDRLQKQQASYMSPARSTGSRTSSDGSGPRREAAEPIDEVGNAVPSVPRLQYHHQQALSESGGNSRQSPYPLQPDLAEAGQSINRHLTPTAQMGKRTPLSQRPISTYSDAGPRGRSPVGINGSPSYGRAPSAHSGRSGERPMSHYDLTNMSYPQAPPAPISLDNSQLRSVVGSNASLLTTQKTLELYRANVKKLNDSETQYAFAIFLIQAAQEAGLQVGDITPRKVSPKPGGRDLDGPYVDSPSSSPQELLSEAKHILQKLADKSYPFAQYYLADGYASGLFSKGKEDYSTAFPLFVAASKHGHAESGYRAALCYEFGWGCRKDAAKAVQFYRQSASKNHPGAMTRLGRANLEGGLGPKQYREGVKWLKRATESADLQYNAAPYYLALIYETGDGVDIFLDEVYAAQLLTQAADLGHVEACYRLGDAYEHGKLSCPRDPALSVHFYTGAAQRGHPQAMMALCAWYMVGAEPVLEKDENEAYEWARQAAETGLTKAEYAMGYFTEMGIGTRRDPLEANVWYVKAADSGDERAKLRLAAIRAAASGGTPMEVAPPRDGAKIKKGAKGDEKTEKDCIVM